jgi:prepilin-type N-terminal cleavage/methylation domain-containing protein
VLSRRGGTLVELLVALAVTALLAAMLTAIATGVLRAALRVREAGVRAETLRSALALARHEFEGLDAAGGDLVVAGDSAARYDAVRGGGHACALLPAALVVPTVALRAVRTPVPGRDGLLVFAEGDSSRTDDDAWVVLGLAGTLPDRCPGGATALRFLSDRALPADVRPGAPFLLREPMELRRYASGGQAWLGARAVATGEVVQPVAGPLAGSGGLSFTSRRADGRLAAPGDTVTGVRVALQAGSATGARDSAREVVPLLGRLWR